MTPKLDMIGLVCKDVASSLRFYSTLGLDVPQPEPGEPFCEMTLDGGVRLSWNDVEMIKSIYPDWEEPVGHRLGLAFLCEGSAGVDATYRKIVEAGYASVKEPFDAFWAQRYAVVKDPDGNLVDLFAPLGG